MSDDIHINTNSPSFDVNKVWTTKTINEDEFMARLNLFFVKKDLFELIDKIKNKHCE
jgi:hypothetical protein